MQAQGTSRTLSILIVEDEPTEAALIARELKRVGLTCNYHRVDTEAAFRHGLQSTPDLVMSDFSMPKFDGMAALRIARKEFPEVPFIIVSGTLGEERAIDALKSGATDYVLKSNLARLAPAVIRALQDVEARRVIRQAEQRFRDLVQTSQDWVWELDVDGHYGFCSPSIQSILDVSADSMLGTHYLHRVHDDDQVLLAGAMRSLGDNERRLSALTARWQHRDGSYRWLERQALAVIDAKGLVTGFRGTDRDITERKRHDEKNQRLNRIYRLLNSVNAAVLRIRDRTELLEEVCRIVNVQGNYALVTILLTDAGTAVLRAVAVAGERAEEFHDFSLRIRLAATEFQSLTEQALCTGLSSVCNDLMNPRARVHWREDLAAWGFRAAAALPLTVAGTAVGTLNLISRECGVFEAEERALLGQLAGTLSFALQYLEKEGQANFLTYFDPMTGLARRTLFCERLAREMLDRTPDAGALEVFILDIQHLSAINDRFGRQGGDQLLQLVAERLKGAVQGPTRLAYFGNGFFGVASNIAGESAMRPEDVRTELSQLLVRPFQIEGQEVPVSAWIGAASFPKDGENAEVLLQNAEHAVKKAKESGERYLTYVHGMKSELYSRMTLEHELQCALEERQFELHYQPKIDLATGKIAGAEALLRWQRPGAGLVSPAEFIPVLEETGLIVKVGQWIIEEAVRVSHRWLDEGLPLTPIAVNVSPVQLKRREFVDFVLAAIETLIGRGGRLDFEITEGALMEDLKGSTKKLQRLFAAGLYIAIDDFGTGYSSLGRLSKLPVHALKIDRSFISDLATSPAQATLVSTIISLAHAFHLCAVAEGVETQEQRRHLQELKCDQYQGYLFARPMPEAEFHKLLLLERGEASVKPAEPRLRDARARPPR